MRKMTINEKECSTKRRRLLQAIGASAGTSALIPGHVAATNTSKRRNMLGTSYDTVTHMEQRRAQANLKSESDGMSGKLSVGGFNVRFGKDEPIRPAQSSGASNVYEFYSTAHTKGNSPLHVKFEDLGRVVAGWITYDDAEHGRLGFSLGKEKAGYSHDKITRALMNKGQGVPPKQDGGDVPDVPNKGVPMNTSMAALSSEGDD